MADDGKHLALARESLRELLEDRRVPAEVRETLADDFAQVQAMLERLEHGQIHIAAFGRVSVGKSATLNALLGTDVEPKFDPPRPGDVRDSLADITQARQCLGYEPEVDFEEGLRRSIAYYKQAAAGK